MSIEERSVPQIRSEGFESGSRRVGFLDDLLDDESEASPQSTGSEEISVPPLRYLMAEREAILADARLSARQKARLLEVNRQTIVVTNGGTIKKTENVVYAILVFGGVMIGVLALLTVFAGLPV